MEYWPLIKVVKIFTKSPVLKTGLVLVDLVYISFAHSGVRKVLTCDVARFPRLQCCSVRDRRDLHRAVYGSLDCRADYPRRRRLNSLQVDERHPRTTTAA